MIGTETLKNRIEAPKMPDRMKTGGKYITPLRNFMDSDDKTLIFKCSNEMEAKICYQALFRYRKDLNLNITVWKRNCTVYAIKG